jgi:HSP20 family protein
MPNVVTRWDPFQEMAGMRNAMDRLLEQSFGRFPALRNGEELGPSSLGLDVVETNDGFVIKAAIPGVDPGEVDISIEDDILTIRGEFAEKDEAQESQYLRRELRYGSFQRSLRLPPTVDPDKSHAEFEHGLLRLTLPKKPEARARSIKITPQGVIEAEHKNQK